MVAGMPHAVITKSVDVARKAPGISLVGKSVRDFGKSNDLFLGSFAGVRRQRQVRPDAGRAVLRTVLNASRIFYEISCRKLDMK